MALNIANRRVEAKAVEVSRLTGKNKTASVEAALDFFLRAHDQHAAQVKQSRRQKMHHVLNRLSDRPVLDPRPAATLRDEADGSGQ